MNSDSQDTNKLNNLIKPQRKLLSFNKTKAFERHPSANGLMVKDDSELNNKIENKNFIFNIVKEEGENETDKKKFENVNIDERKKSCFTFQFKIQKIEQKLFNDEVFYTKNENVENENNKEKKEKKFFPNNHKLYEFSEEDKKLDSEITKAIQSREKEDVIINKINIIKKD